MPIEDGVLMVDVTVIVELVDIPLVTVIEKLLFPWLTRVLLVIELLMARGFFRVIMLDSVG